MEDKILKQIESEVGRIINEAPYKRDGLGRFYGHQTFTNKLIEAAKFGYNIKESVDVDWKKLRDEYFDEHVQKDTGGYIHITTAAHDLFEWFKSKLSSSQNTVINKGEKWVSVEDRLPDENTPVLLKFIRLVGMFDDELIRIGKYRISEVGNTFLTEDMRRHSISETTHWMPLPNPPKEK